jgi:hypothetical protein
MLSLDDAKGGLSRQSFSYAAKGVDFKFNKQNIDPTFDRIGDLAGFTPAEKQVMTAERGYDRTDWTAAINSVRGLTLATFNYDAKNASQDLDKSAWKHNLGWNASKLTQINFLSEGNRLTANGQTTDSLEHELFTLNHQINKGMKLSFYRDTVATTASGTEKPDVVTNFLHLESDRAKGNNWLAETKRVLFSDGKYENTTHLDLNYTMGKNIVLHLNKLGIDRGADPSSDTSLLDWKWQINKGTSFNGSYATTVTNNDANATMKSFAVSSAAIKNFSVTGSYTEVSQKTNVKTVTDVAISHAKPINVAGLKNVVFAAKYASLRDQNKQQSQNVSGKVQAMAGKNQIGLEYGSILNPNGTNAIARIITLLTDPNPKLPFHADILYKARTVNRGNVDLVRKYNASLKLDKTTNVTYNYQSLTEDAAGAMQPMKSSALAIKRNLDKNLNLSVDYTTSKKFAELTDVSKLGGSLTGKVDPLSAVEVGYSIDISNLKGQHSDAHTIRLSYDHQVNGEQFVTLSTSYRDIRGSVDEMTANVDLKTRF